MSIITTNITTIMITTTIMTIITTMITTTIMTIITTMITTTAAAVPARAALPSVSIPLWKS